MSDRTRDYMKPAPMEQGTQPCYLSGNSIVYTQVIFNI